MSTIGKSGPVRLLYTLDRELEKGRYVSRAQTLSMLKRLDQKITAAPLAAVPKKTNKTSVRRPTVAQTTPVFIQAVQDVETIDRIVSKISTFSQVVLTTPSSNVGNTAAIPASSTETVVLKTAVDVEVLPFLSLEKANLHADPGPQSRLFLGLLAAVAASYIAFKPIPLYVAASVLPVASSLNWWHTFPRVPLAHQADYPQTGVFQLGVDAVPAMIGAFQHAFPFKVGMIPAPADRRIPQAIEELETSAIAEAQDIPVLPAHQDNILIDALLAKPIHHIHHIQHTWSLSPLKTIWHAWWQDTIAKSSPTYMLQSQAILEALGQNVSADSAVDTANGDDDPLTWYLRTAAAPSEIQPAPAAPVFEAPALMVKNAPRLKGNQAEVLPIEAPTQWIKRSAASPKQTFDQNLKQANHMARQGDVLGAIALVKTLVHQNPHNAKAWSTLGELYLQSNQVSALKRLLSELNEEVMQADPIKLLRARLFLMEENAQAAIEELSHLSGDMIDFDHIYVLAMTYQKLQSHEKAVDVYWELVRRHPQEGRGWVGLAMSLEALKDFPNAVSSYKRALNYSLDPTLKSYTLNRLSHLAG